MLHSLDIDNADSSQIVPHDDGSAEVERVVLRDPLVLWDLQMGGFMNGSIRACPLRCLYLSLSLMPDVL